MSAGVRRFDVAVIGGGSAGIAAAVTSARSGARTILIERHGYTGGMGTVSLVHSFCGLYLLREEPGTEWANHGFPVEIAERMMAATGIGPLRVGRVDVLPQHPVEFVRIADEILGAERELEVLLHAEAFGISRDADGWELRLHARAGEIRIAAGALVDASGDAMVAAWLGEGFAMAAASRLQRPSYVFAVRNPSVMGEAMRLRTSGLLVEGVRAGLIPEQAMGLTFRESGRPGEIFGTIDLAGGTSPGEYDPLDASCLSALEIEGRRIASLAVRWLAERDEAWRGCYISHWPVRAGIRESRRWIGDAVLTGDDMAAGRRFDDEIALATWPMEFRENAKGPKLRFPEGNRPCGIPAGCLKPRGIDRIFVAGRCISTDHDAQASIRVMGTCFATGQAAGRMAAGC
jgi:hypothetical protein